jgi:hypothetical protein
VLPQARDLVGRNIRPQPFAQDGRVVHAKRRLELRAADTAAAFGHQLLPGGIVRLGGIGDDAIQVPDDRDHVWASPE